MHEPRGAGSHPAVSKRQVRPGPQSPATAQEEACVGAVAGSGARAADAGVDAGAGEGRAHATLAPAEARATRAIPAVRKAFRCIPRV